ncbi:aldolase/citrate lyase family protein [Herbiconiux sp. KACC 21604]|uniref:HpcH/HpaI aldolase family protein n=1 Tax=unclassified Herbiconiux TaxID=2618217 RepID=UPI001492F465|nr:aldolase/citrate lyase family protein [Herbiconiux sp. SALV-R1]QJU54547.1 2,4-dihydroxyhept-2-ene-1,7-dioic acid aldolase [Herbiconiux sp. SALV-R1]WPO85631.1 aldolase/citrate lyase family protein [Herbiconiux sp. KACC 21604]
MIGQGTRTSLFRAALARPSGPPLGTWSKIPAQETVELLALAGFDFVVIDLEHSAMSAESASRQIGVALLAGLSPIVRVPSLAGGLVQRMLDAGAEGIMLPHVDSVEEARAAAAAVRFPPAGTRGVGSTSRAGAWGAVPREEYLRFGDEVVLIAQIESAAAARAAGEIAAVDGVDALLVGAADLSVSEGLDESDPRVLRLIADAVEAAHAVGVPVGNAGGATTDAVRASIDAGFDFTMLSNDASLLGGAATAAVRAARSVSAERAAESAGPQEHHEGERDA